MTYLALALKSNAIYQARLAAQKDAQKTLNAPVPLQIRNAPTKLMKDLGYGKNYQLAHNTADKLTSMKTMPPEIQGHRYYYPSDQGHESRFKERLQQIQAWHQKHDSL